MTTHLKRNSVILFFYPMDKEKATGRIFKQKLRENFITAELQEVTHPNKHRTLSLVLPRTKY
jgi:hypothetical protein